MEPSKNEPQEASSERMLESLKQSERRFRAIYEQAPIGMSLVDIRTGRFIQFNAKYCEITGRTPQELSQTDFQTLTHPDDLPANLEYIHELRAGVRRSFQIEKRYLRPDNTTIWVCVTVVPMWADGAEPDYYMSLTEDISERKAIESARQRQATFDTLITEILARFAFCTGAEIDHEIRESLQEVGRFIGSEEAFVILLEPDMSTWSVAYGWSIHGANAFEKFIKIPLGQSPWVEQQLFSGESIQIAQPEDWPREAAMERKFDEAHGLQSLLLLPLRGRGGQITGCVGLRTLSQTMQWAKEDVRRLRILTDAIANVLERKRVENALRDSRQMLRQVLDTIPQRVFWKDRNFRFLGCNESFVRDTKMGSADEVIGKTDEQVWGKENSERCHIMDRKVFETGQPQLRFEELLTLNNGQSAWVNASKVPLRDFQGRIFGVLGTYEDVTALRQARLALEQAKESAEAANEAKDQFIAVLSHELRTPLTPVLAMVTAMEETDTIPERLRGDVETIHRNVELEARLIDDLLDVTRISQGKLILWQETVDAHLCFQSALEICKVDLESKHLQLSIQLDAPHHFVWADPARLRQVFWNLIKNAIKFTPEDGRIEIRSWNEEARLKITIEDTGIGIQPEAIPRVFNAFEQGEVSRRRHFGGLGLGLSIAHAIMEMHQGKLTAKSEGKDKGACFIMELATVPAPLEPSEAPPRYRPEATQPRRILLVEDHEDTLRILARLLRKWGYVVTTASSVKTALERASEQNFDLLISDLGLPDGSGYDIVRQLDEGFPAIALSGYGTDEDIRMSQEAGFAEHLTKPVSFQTLRAAVDRLIPSAPKQK